MAITVGVARLAGADVACAFVVDEVVADWTEAVTLVGVLV